MCVYPYGYGQNQVPEHVIALAELPSNTDEDQVVDTMLKVKPRSALFLARRATKPNLSSWTEIKPRRPRRTHWRG